MDREFFGGNALTRSPRTNAMRITNRLSPRFWLVTAVMRTR